MSFLHPGLAMAAVVAATLPLLLHLLLRRPKVTAWPSTMLLQRAIDRMRRRRTLDRWLLLALRVLATLLIGLAMAGPLAGGGTTSTGRRTTWLLIDDGATSAERLSGDTTSLARSVREASAAIDRMREGDAAGLIVAGRPAQVLAQPTGDLTRVRRLLQSLEPRAVPTDLVDAMALAVPSQDSTTDAMIFSGWRRGALRGSASGPGSLGEQARRLRWIALPPLGQPGPNRAIVNAEVRRVAADDLAAPGRSIRVGLTRTGDMSAAIDTFRLNAPTNEVITQGEARWQSSATDIEVETEWRDTSAGAGTVSMDGDVQPLDDTSAVVWESRPDPRVWVVGRGSDAAGVERASSTSWVMRAVESTGLVPQEIDPTSLALRTHGAADAIVVCRPDLVDAAGWAWLSTFMGDGGTLLVMPAPDVKEQPWFVDASRALGVDLVACGEARDSGSSLAAEQPRGELLSLLGAEVDQLAGPVRVSRRIDLTPLSGTTTPVLVFDDGSPAMVLRRSDPGGGCLLLLAMSTDIAWTDLPLKPLMVPLLQESVRSGVTLAASNRRLMVASKASLGKSAAGGMLHPARPAMGSPIEIDGDGRLQRAVPSPGLWRLRRTDGSEAWHAVMLQPADADIGAVQRSELLAWSQAAGDWRWSDEAGQEAATGQASESPWTWLLLLLGVACLGVETPWSRRGSPRPAIGVTAG